MTRSKLIIAGAVLVIAGAGLLWFIPAYVSGQRGVSSGASNSSVDPRLIGTWQGAITNEHGKWSFVFEPQPTGSYRTRISGPTPFPDETGTIVAKNSSWKLNKDNGQTDFGSYQFTDSNTVIFKGIGGTITWHRVNAPSSQATQTLGSQSQPVAQSGGPAGARSQPALIIAPHPAPVDPEADRIYQRGKALAQANRFTEAMPLLLQAANRGHATAQHLLGFIYQEGQPGVPKNEPQAASWFSKAAAQGNRASQYALGSMYDEGEGGLPKDVGKAAQLYEASARQGFEKAQFAFGLVCEFNLHDRSRAISWLELAGKQGEGRARWAAEWLRRPDTPHFQDESSLQPISMAKLPNGWRPANRKHQNPIPFRIRNIETNAPRHWVRNLERKPPANAGSTDFVTEILECWTDWMS